MGNARPFIIALTGYGQESDRRQATESGIDVHFVKPADIDKLLARIAVACADRTRQPNKIEVA
jgi:DNA-binding response OmpR family regulator